MSKIFMPGVHTVRALRFDTNRVYDLFGRFYNRRGAESLRRIRKIFGLNCEETAALFHVSRQAMKKWESTGVPTRRLADVDRVAHLADFMTQRLRPERLPALVRTHAADLGDRNVLEVIRVEGPRPVLDYMHRLSSGIPR